MSDMGQAIPPTPSTPKNQMSGMLKTALIAGVAFLVGLGVGVAGSGESDNGVTASSPTASAAPGTSAPSSPTDSSNEESTSPSPTSEPQVLDGTWQLTSCDLQLFVGGSDDSLLVAAVVAENTGNVPAEVTVSVKWDALPGPLFDGGEKVVTLEPGRSRELKFQERIGGYDVDRVQSSTGYQAADDAKFCKTKASIDNA